VVIRDNGLVYCGGEFSISLTITVLIELTPLTIKSVVSALLVQIATGISSAWHYRNYNDIFLTTSHF
jgi:hypothetical protein